MRTPCGPYTPPPPPESLTCIETSNVRLLLERNSPVSGLGLPHISSPIPRLSVYTGLPFIHAGTHGSVVLEALRYKSEVGGGGSVLDGIIGIFHRLDPSGRAMVLASTQPTKGMSTMNLSWGGKGGHT
jgi:hypothetical protein